MQAGGFLAVPSATITRPADTSAYASGDLVANNTTASLVVPLIFTGFHRFSSGGTGLLRGCSVSFNDTVTTNAQFRVHWWTRKTPGLPNEYPTFANGDNGAFSANEVAQYLGRVDVTVDQAFTDGAWGAGLPLIGTERPFDLGGGNKLIAAIEARAAYTPTSGEIFTVTPYILQL